MFSTADLRRRYRPQYTAPGQSFRLLSKFYLRAYFAVRFFYVYSCVIAYNLLSGLYDVAQSPASIWLWPVAWLNYLPPALVEYFGSILFLVLFFASMFPHRREIRIAAFMLALFAVAMVNSQGAINHGYHMWLWITFLFIFLPRLSETERRKSVMLSTLTVIVGVQASMALFYTLSGMWKLAYGLAAIQSGEQGNFSLSGLASQLANRTFQSTDSPLMVDFIIANQWVGAVGLWCLIALQSMSFAIILVPALHRGWGALLILFHFGTWALMSIAFPLHVLWLLMFFVWSPFRNSVVESKVYKA